MRLATFVAAALVSLSALAAEPANAPEASAGKAAAAPADQTAVIPVKGMHCGGCVGHVNDAVKKLDGVKSVHTDLEKARTTVVFDSAKLKPEDLVSAITESGYEPGKPVLKK